MSDTTPPNSINTLNLASEQAAEEGLRACCASRRWVTEMVRMRPYDSITTLRETSDAVLDALPWDDVLEAVRAHPRIGERAAQGGTEAQWSSEEQAASADADDQVRAELDKANREYEDRFGHVFLICATGLSAGDVLDAVQLRLPNEPTAEQTVVRTELTRLVGLRLEKLVRQ